MEKFDELLAISDILLGPNGCPWDKEQTLTSLLPYLLEETHELIEAIELKDPQKIIEEMGDMFYELVFLAKIGERDGVFQLNESLQSEIDKLIRRHPHVFGNQKASTPEEVLKKWEEAKKKEGKKNPIDGIPPTLPALARAQKVISKLRRVRCDVVENDLRGEEELGQRLWNLVKEADSKGIDAEGALRKICLEYEEKHRR
jgi:tetrapyrrole methylase family protein / MazG family protein